MKQIKALGIALLAMLVITSCKKEGPAGPAGADGNANVIATNNVTVSNWTASNPIWSATIAVPGITSDIVNRGVVQVFIQYGNQWVSLPDITGQNSTVYAFGVGSIDLINSNADGSMPTNPGTQTFRIVIISASARQANPDVDLNNYEAVKSAYHLKD